MNDYFLDTSVIIDYLRQKDQIVTSLFSLDGNITSSYLCLAELYEGAYKAHNTSQIKADIQSFFRTLAKVYTVNKRVAEVFGSISAELKRSGEVIGDIDIFIAAICIAYDLNLLTLNYKHFMRIKGLKIYPLT